MTVLHGLTIDRNWTRKSSGIRGRNPDACTPATKKNSSNSAHHPPPAVPSAPASGGIRLVRGCVLVTPMWNPELPGTRRRGRAGRVPPLRHGWSVAARRRHPVESETWIASGSPETLPTRSETAARQSAHRWPWRSFGFPTECGCPSAAPKNAVSKEEQAVVVAKKEFLETFGITARTS